MVHLFFSYSLLYILRFVNQKLESISQFLKDRSVHICGCISLKSTIGVDLQQYRATIGSHYNFRVNQKKDSARLQKSFCIVSQQSYTMFTLLYTLILVYFVPLLLSMHILSSFSMEYKYSLKSFLIFDSKSLNSNLNYSICLLMLCISRIFSKTIITRLFPK